MALYNTEAIIIRVRDFDEADKVAVLLSPTEGKFQAVAKGARRPRNRYAGATQLFTRVRASLFHGRNLDTFSQIEIVESFRHLREDLVRLAYGTYACELMDELFKEKQKLEATYVLLLTTLHLLNEPGMEPEPVLRAYELKLLSMLGFRPKLDTCVSCGGELEEGATVRFAPALGGTLCSRCASEGEIIQRLSRGALESMRRLMEGDIRRAHVVRLNGEIMREVDRALTEYLSARLERNLKSKEFLDSLRFDPARP